MGRRFWLALGVVAVFLATVATFLLLGARRSPSLAERGPCVSSNELVAALVDGMKHKEAGRLLWLLPSPEELKIQGIMHEEICGPLSGFLGFPGDRRYYPPELPMLLVDELLSGPLYEFSEDRAEKVHARMERALRKQMALLEKHCSVRGYELQRVVLVRATDTSREKPFARNSAYGERNVGDLYLDLDDGRSQFAVLFRYFGNLKVYDPDYEYSGYGRIKGGVRIDSGFCLDELSSVERQLMGDLAAWLVNPKRTRLNPAALAVLVRHTMPKWRVLKELGLCYGPASQDHWVYKNDWHTITIQFDANDCVASTLLDGGAVDPAKYPVGQKESTNESAAPTDSRETHGAPQGDVEQP